MSVTRVWVHRIEIQNEPGSLRSLLLQLAESGVDLLCVDACTCCGKCSVNICGKDPRELKAAVDKAGIGFTEMAGFLISGDDKVGAGAQALKNLADAGINGIAGSAMVFDGHFKMLIIVDDADGDAAEKALFG
jgi:hypothetical protein